MFDAAVEPFLKVGRVDIEGKDLPREGMLGGEVFRAPDAVLPGSGGHWAIMGLRLAAGNCREFHRGVRGSR